MRSHIIIVILIFLSSCANVNISKDISRNEAGNDLGVVVFCNNKMDHFVIYRYGSEQFISDSVKISGDTTILYNKWGYHDMRINEIELNDSASQNYPSCNLKGDFNTEVNLYCKDYVPVMDPPFGLTIDDEHLNDSQTKYFHLGCAQFNRDTTTSYNISLIDTILNEKIKEFHINAETPSCEIILEVNYPHYYLHGWNYSNQDSMTIIGNDNNFKIVYAKLYNELLVDVHLNLTENYNIKGKNFKRAFE